jgi:outer membrane protein assembly factor BamA
LERDLLGGRLRPLIGFQVRHVDIDDLTGKQVKKIAEGSSKGTQLPTRLLEDCAAGVIIGCDGGWDNYFRFGLTYDSRNFEPNPGRGILAEMIASVSSKVIGSEEDYQRVTFSVSGFHDFLETRPTTQNKLTVAGRAVYNMQFGDVPLIGLQRLGFADFDRRGAGGFLTLRGFKNQRFIGESAALLAGEIRYFFTEWQFWGQHLVPGVAAFIDTGRAFTDVDFKFKNWQVAGGGGFRLA